MKDSLKSNYGDEKQKQRMLDLLHYQLNEIQDADIKEDEEEYLDSQRKLIQNSEKILDNLKKVDGQLNNNVLTGIENAVKYLTKIEDFDLKYSKNLEELNNIYYGLQEITSNINTFSKDIDFDEQTCNKIITRIDSINDLKRKYGNSIVEILNYKEEVVGKIEKIENAEEYINKLKIRLNIVKEEMLKYALKMNKIREEFALRLENSINNELKDLEMKNARFIVKIEYSNEEVFNSSGLDKVEFMIITNLGEEEKPLVKVASGGEISRVMLAVKTALARVDKVPVMVFDEIDTGISGISAKAVCQKLRRISHTHQILCVTHLAVIAAGADYNYLIKKNQVNNKTKTQVTLLKESDAINEIARIATGDITSIAIQHATELKRSVIAV
ncbi:MAG: hypothetical protein RSE00_02460 [Clostridia bacterium]